MPAPPLGITARATVDRVIDGDTLDVHLMIPVRVRLLNCWAPELHEANAGPAAKEALETIAPPGSALHLHVPTQQADAMIDVLTFGRVLGEAYLDGDDDSLSHHMVSLGYATREKP